ncbi:MAG: class I SAM-dependent methyltransferase [Planctomycetes bacterium]|nr:class I SAM-dependent methyltransferase [Planctomycetota bacterium]
MMRHRTLLAMLPALFLFVLVLPPQTKGGDKKDDEKKYNLIYVPTEEKVIEKMFDMAKVKKGDVVFDLGCGDGRIIAMAAKKFGTRGVGVDLNPERIRECMDTIKKYGVESHVDKGLVEYRLGDALRVPDLNQASVIMLYMLPEFMDMLEPIAKKCLKPGSRVVSHDYRWKGKDWEPEQTIHFEGPTRTHTLYLWTVKESK